MMDDANRILLEHVERLARELREVRDGQRELRDSTRRIEDELDRRSNETTKRRIRGESAAIPPEVSLSPSRALSLSLPNPPEEEKKTPSALSDFAGFLAKEWPDIKRPPELEVRARAAFPGVDLFSEAQKARGWECSDPKRRKRNHGKFLWGWLGRAQDGASRLLHPVQLVPDRPKATPEQSDARKAAHALYLKNKSEQEAAERELAGRRAWKG